MIFLSHSWNEKPAARQVVEELSRRGIPCWLDEQQLSPGAQLRSSLLDTISKCQVYLYLVSSRAAESSWVQDELSHALSCEREKLLTVIPVRLPSDTTPLPGTLTGRLFKNLASESGGAASLAHDLSSLAESRTLIPGSHISATVRLTARRAEHTLRETSALAISSQSRRLLVLDSNYDRIDTRYWKVAHTKIPDNVRGAPHALDQADHALDSVHAQCRRAIDAIDVLALEHLKADGNKYESYYRSAIDRALFVILHRLDWNCRYLGTFSDDSPYEFNQHLVDQRQLPNYFGGHACDFVVDGRGFGKANVPAHGHPGSQGQRVRAWGLTSPFSDLSEVEVGTAVGEIVSRYALARDTPPVVPDPEKLLYGLA